ncbi:Crp/Fnr family transcriptional regulator [Flavobacterium subsaxonicum]|uniref:Cyclic nucleotide-binding protein n=1 Tax=Flavobacterium subsaxonicum WB 4.1-42 = DSM 21790 TaxID=1121898 RepID=A0A0A2MJ82_9FLAO|nr:Crp/Fnr family transcriptional regulator [Flavobacterium subsaxonicum]KGO92359.1 cyclic nucleotide-binding protein [Flavobacterium subsaxonicum WB 4.1-42 = DSM 21790]
MFEILADYLRVNAALTDKELEQVRAHSLHKKLRKKQYLLQEGDISNFNCFVAKGCLRLYNVGSNGTEYILRFAIENWWMSDYESFNAGTPSKNYIDALEDSDVLLIDKEHFNELVMSIPKLQDFVQRLENRAYTASQNRILSNISDTAEERYEKFVKAYPDVFNRVPLRMIASYIGLTRETLSRVRSQYAKTESKIM